jgi:DUF177 domain-containing protein
MDLNLEQAFEEPIELSHRFEVPAARLGRPELVSLDPVAFRGRLEKADPGFLLNGELQMTGAVSCVRCLKEVPFRRRTAVAWAFAPEHERPNEEELELKSEDLDVVWYADLVVPLDPLIDEQIQLELPMKPLCAEGCRGLCPQCGADLNAVPCACEKPADDRWTPLKSLLG